MRHMGNSGKIALGAFPAALALLVLTGLTLHEAVFACFVAASATAYVACVAEVIRRRRHLTLAASGLGSTLFLAFGIAFLRQWGLAFNPDPAAMSAPVNAAHPDLYFYLAAASGTATLLLLFAGTVLPGRRRKAGAGRRPGTPRSAVRPAIRATAPRRPAGTPRAPVTSPSGTSAARPPARLPAKAGTRR